MVNKNIRPGILIIALVFGMTVVGCKDDSKNTNTTDSGLNGTWVSENGYEIKLNNGSFELSTTSIKMIKGTYTTSGKNITMQVTHVHSDMVLMADYIANIPFPIPSGWYTSAQLKQILKGVSSVYPELDNVVIDLAIDSMFTQETGTYSVSGNTLTLTIYGETTTYTKK